MDVLTYIVKFYNIQKIKWRNYFNHYGFNNKA
jgi:hypothetical protein